MDGSEPPKILVIDDDPDVVTLTKDLLEVLGYSAMAVRSYDDALALWPSERERVGLVLLDFTLGDRTGDELAEFFLKDKPGLNIVLMTGAGAGDLPIDDELRAKLRFLPKPFTFAQLRQCVRENFG